MKLVDSDLVNVKREHSLLPFFDWIKIEKKNIVFVCFFNVLFYSIVLKSFVLQNTKIELEMEKSYLFDKNKFVHAVTQGPFKGRSVWVHSFPSRIIV